MFKDLQTGYPVYVFIKGETPQYKEGTFERVVKPPVENLNPNDILKLSENEKVEMLQRVQAQKNGALDMIIKVEGQETTIRNVNLNSTIVSSPAITIACTKDAILTDINVTLTNSRRHIEDVPKHENIITECELILNQIDPSKMKIIERDQKIDTLTDLVAKQSDQISTLQELLTKQLSMLNKDNEEQPVKTTKNK